MSIIYSSIYRDKVPLVEFTDRQSSFSQITQMLVEYLEQEDRQCYTIDNFTFYI